MPGSAQRKRFKNSNLRQLAKYLLTESGKESMLMDREDLKTEYCYADRMFDILSVINFSYSEWWRYIGSVKPRQPLYGRCQPERAIEQ